MKFKVLKHKLNGTYGVYALGQLTESNSPQLMAHDITWLKIHQHIENDIGRFGIADISKKLEEYELKDVTLIDGPIELWIDTNPKLPDLATHDLRRGWSAGLEGTPIVAFGSTEEEAIDELMISIRVALLHKRDQKKLS